MYSQKSLALFLSGSKFVFKLLEKRTCLKLFTSKNDKHEKTHVLKITPLFEVFLFFNEM